MAFLMVLGCQNEAVIRLKRLLAEQLESDAGLYGLDALNDQFDVSTDAAVRRWQSGVGLIADGVVGSRCGGILGLRCALSLETTVTPTLVSKLFPGTKPANIVRFLPYVLAALEAEGLTDRDMVLMALGTIRAETAGFVPIAELVSKYNTPPGGAPFSLYNGLKRLGNSQMGDGPRFKGRGFVQLTGRFNYTYYGKQLGVDLVSHPDWANGPEIAAALLAKFLSDKAIAIRNDITTGNLAQARKRVNGGRHGLDSFSSVFKLAEAHWPSGMTAIKSGSRSTSGQRRSIDRALTVNKDPIDLRDRAYMPPPVTLPEQFPEDKIVHQFLPRYVKLGLVLDQGREGACTGFGLAAVVNYLRWTKLSYPTHMDPVSPRMLYEYARRYDEYEGEDYQGSSCRGALKGWYQHGVCLANDWEYSDDRVVSPKYGFAHRAREHTLGVYYRVDIGSLTDLQAAIVATGAVFVSAFTHAGWDTLPSRSKPPQGHADLPVIDFDGHPSVSNGHAFALVGFNGTGFVIQNSWGNQFGYGGFAVLSYADWLTNAMDAWVVSLGVPGVVAGQARPVGRAANRAGSAKGWGDDAVGNHSVILGNDGRVRRYLTQDEPSRNLMYQGNSLPDQWFRSQPQAKLKRLVIYAHGGLNSEEASLKRASVLGPYLEANGCYPMFLVWKTGLLETIRHQIADAVPLEPVRAGGWLEKLSEKTDLLIERTLGRSAGRPIWSEMKENAGRAFFDSHGGHHLLTALRGLRDTWGQQLEIHLVGHSAGAILLGHMLKAMHQRGLTEFVKSTHLYAPACSVQFANEHYAPLPAVMKNLYMHVLSDQQERDDNVAFVYRKSLLYMVSNVLEPNLRTPILGMDRVMDPNDTGWEGSSSTADALKLWRQAFKEAGLRNKGRYMVLSEPRILTATAGGIHVANNHGNFDNAVPVVTQTLERIAGGPLSVLPNDLRGY